MSPDDQDLEEASYVKEDRRASHRPEPEPGAAEPKTKPDEEGERPPITVHNVLRLCLTMLAEQAWVHMGLHPDSSTGKVEANLPMAKVAIDTIAFIVQQLQPDLDATEQRELETLLANLRVNYVQRA